MSDRPVSLDSGAVRRRFGRAAKTFDDADFLYRHSFDGLLSRLAPMQIDPRVVVDLGAATGRGTGELARRFRGARVLAIDFAMPMLEAARGRRGWLSKTREICADAGYLPLADHSADVVIANMLLPWVPDPDRVFREIARVLKPGGLFAFASLGPESLETIRHATNDEDDARFHLFADMHDVGDGLLRAGLAEPVLDVDRLDVTYPDAERLFRDALASGAGNARRDRLPTLAGKGRLGELANRLESAASPDGLRLSFEIVYGHAWGRGAQPERGEFHIDTASIGRRHRP